MNLGGTVTYNSLSVNTITQQSGGNPLSGYAIERFEAEPPPPTNYLEKRALADGLDASDVYLGGRTFRLVVTAYGTTAGDFWDKAQALIQAFTPTNTLNPTVTAGPTQNGFLPLAFFQPTAKVAQWPTSAYPSGIPMQYNVRPIQGPSYVLERDKDGGVTTDPRSKSFDIRLIARDPRKIHGTQTTVSMTTTSQTLSTAQYRGDYPALPVIQVVTSAAGHSAFTIGIGNLNVALNLTSESTGVTLYWDFSTRTLWNEDYGGVDAIQRNSLITAVVGAEEGYPSVEAGTEFLYSNGTGVSTVKMLYYEAWT